MIEQTVRDYLENKLDVPVFLMEPESIPPEYVTIERTGGGITNYIEHPTIAIQTYGVSLYRAALLMEEVKKAMKFIVELNPISSVELNASYNFTNTETKQFRYQAVYDITYLGG